MADQQQYTGVTYDSSYYRQPNEAASDYFMRLAQQRAGGILGGGGMLDTPAPAEITEQPLGQEVKNCPAGYVLRNGACVRASENNGEDTEQRAVSNEERYKGARMLLDNPMLATGIRALMPLGLGHLFMSDNQLEGYVRNTQNEATKSQGFLDYLMGNDGDVVLGDRGTGTGSLVTGQPSVVSSMFSEYIGQPFDASRYTNDPNVISGYNVKTTPAPLPVNFLAQQEAQLQRTMGMMDTLNQLNSGSTSGGSSGYYSDSSGSYTGGSDYGGWTGVTSDGSGNDWDSFGGDDTY